MFKVVLLVALAIAGCSAQQVPEGASAPEPYAYAYQTDSHAASEQRGPDGRVVGFYTLADADGRQRRVEYYADESGFHAKVQTNEVGTKSENSADVEVQADPPTREQLQFAPSPVPQQPLQFVQSQSVLSPPQQSVKQEVVQQEVVPTSRSLSSSFVQQPSSLGYYQYPGSYSTALGQYGRAGYYGYNGYQPVYNYYNPGSYYRNFAGYSGTVPAGSFGSRNSYYQTIPYLSSVYQTYGTPGVSYQTIGAPRVSYQTSAVRAPGASSANLAGSSNYILLKK